MEPKCKPKPLASSLMCYKYSVFKATPESQFSALYQFSLQGGLAEGQWASSPGTGPWPFAQQPSFPLLCSSSAPLTFVTCHLQVTTDKSLPLEHRPQDPGIRETTDILGPSSSQTGLQEGVGGHLQPVHCRGQRT